MARRFARVILASALVVPVVAGAAPGRNPQTAQVAPSQTGLSFTVDPVDPQHTKLVVTAPDITLSLAASSVNLTYTATGLVVDMKGPGTLTMDGTTSPVSDLGTEQLTFTDGKLVKIQFRDSGKHTFPCDPARNVGHRGCAAGSSSGSD
jgi:hypothetical protein